LADVPSGLPCDVPNDDVFGDMLFSTRHPIGAKPYGCVVVSATDAHPVFDGISSARFQVGPDDCSGNSGFDDCANDRSRHEIGERLQPTNGHVIRYETHVFIPSQQPFKPSGGNILFLTQINFNEPFGIVAYLEVGPSNQLMIRTHVGLTTDILKKYPVATQVFDRWIQVDYEIKSTPQDDGYLKVFVDGVLAVDETRQTLPSSRASNSLTLGIYNAFKSRASEPFGTQVVYFDGVRKIVQ